jgi:putative LysE/RhtB family amino acid efflux pump
LPHELFLRGLAIGFAVAFALGPIGLLVIRRTIEHGWAYGLVSGLGVATADATYGAIAAFGLTAVTEILVGAARPLGVIGGLALVALSANGLRGALGPSRPPSAEVATDPLEPSAPQVLDAGAPLSVRPGGDRERQQRGRGPDRWLAAWATLVALTLSNPTTILSFIALFASIGAGTAGAAGAVAVVAGVFAGSMVWWVALTGLVAGLRARLTIGIVRGLNVASSLIIGAFGVVAIGLAISG